MQNKVSDFCLDTEFSNITPSARLYDFSIFNNFQSVRFFSTPGDAYKLTNMLPTSESVWHFHTEGTVSISYSYFN